MELTEMPKGKILVAILLVLSGMMSSAQTSVWVGNKALWSSGSGTESDPYLIESAGNLAYLAYMVNKGFDTEGMSFRLTTDIDLNGSEDRPWEPIGMGDRWSNEDGCDRGVLDCGSSFRGHFDGGGHSITNIYVDERYTDAGLFGSVVGQSDYYAVIENVSVASGVVRGKNCGGIVGKGNFLRVSCCWNGSTVEGDMVGGIMGIAENVEINNCYNKGVILGDDANAMVGGLVGVTQGDVQLANNYNVGDISETNHVGCLIGNQADGVLVVENSHYLDVCSQSEYGTPQNESFMRGMEFVSLLNSSNPELVWAFDADDANDGFPILASSVFLVNVIADPSEGGSVQGSGIYSYGTSVTLTASANENYHFVSWSDGNTDNPHVVTVTGEVSYIAHFELDSYEITVTINPVGGGEVIGAGIYHYGDTAVLNVIPNEHYLFQYWMEYNEVVSEAETFSFIVDQSHEITANFIHYNSINITSSSVRVFPNPARDFLFVKGEGIRKVTVLNVVGQVMDEFEIDGQNQTQISLKNYSSGVFLIKAHLKNGSALVRFVKL